MTKRTTTSLLALLPLAAFAQETTTSTGASPTADYPQLDTFQVIGSKEAVFDIPGSSFYFGEADLERFKFSNINDILRQAPGVYVRDEDGFGIFPNISIRGVDTNRSAKVTLMEDGILTAPAPYSSPAAYYSPTAGRMSGIEILKGSSQIQYGPHTTGGVINYLSTPIPEQTEGFIEASYGNYDTVNGHLWYGGKNETEFGTFGALIEVYREQSDGFRDIQPSVNGNFAGSDDTGYEKTDLMVKLSFEPNWQRRNYFELKIGYSDMDADQTYLGLDPVDLSNDPWEQYAATAADNIETEHFRTYLRHLIEFDSDSKLTTTAYFNSFARDWLKLDKVDGDNPAQAILSKKDVLNGTTAGDFKIKSNDREYYLYGIQSKLDQSFETGNWQHDLTIGARLHADKIDRFQDAFTFTNVFAGDFDFSDPSTFNRTFADQEGDREQETTALALFVHDRISSGNWTFTPGVRWEYIDWDYIRRDKRTPPDAGSGNYSVFAYGLGFEYDISDSQSKIFGGYHRGFSLPGPGSRNKGFDEETSDTVELGYRYQNANSFYAEAVVFYTALSDLIVEDSIAGASSGEVKNVGDTETLGLELLLGADLGQLLDQPFGIPTRLAFTYTDATLDGDARSEKAQSIFAAGEDGNQVPYVPEVQFSFTTGLEFEKFSTYTTITYVDERFADAGNSSAQLNTATPPEADSRFGKLDSFVTVDLSAFYQLTDDLEVFAKASNLFEEEYISSRIPLGPRAGAPRLFSAGFNYRF
ncbi:MAG: TonB-dependent receptor [Verrucomicrobia bacterium]|jgi:Fe(3+) dicitrate transport protein|nr:TonB-dependent receptor [Verrucomicrobiota bacterium]